MEAAHTCSVKGPGMESASHQEEGEEKWGPSSPGNSSVPGKPGQLVTVRV